MVFLLYSERKVEDEIRDFVISILTDYNSDHKGKAKQKISGKKANLFNLKKKGELSDFQLKKGLALLETAEKLL